MASKTHLALADVRRKSAGRKGVLRRPFSLHRRAEPCSRTHVIASKDVVFPLLVRGLSTMDSGVAWRAQRDQVVLGVGSRMAAEL